jgi:hypothetical protein
MTYGSDSARSRQTEFKFLPPRNRHVSPPADGAQRRAADGARNTAF